MGGKAPCDAHFQFTFHGTFQGDRMDGTAGRRFAAAGSMAMSAAWTPSLALACALGWSLLGGPAAAWQGAAPAAVPAAAAPAPVAQAKVMASSKGKAKKQAKAA